MNGMRVFKGTVSNELPPKLKGPERILFWCKLFRMSACLCNNEGCPTGTVSCGQPNAECSQGSCGFTLNFVCFYSLKRPYVYVSAKWLCILWKWPGGTLDPLILKHQFFFIMTEMDIWRTDGDTLFFGSVWWCVMSRKCLGYNGLVRYAEFQFIDRVNSLNNDVCFRGNWKMIN